MRVSLNRQVTVEVPPTARNSVDGTPEGSWTALVYLAGSPAVAERFWVEAQDVLPSRTEESRQGLIVGARRTRIRMRWRNDITQAMRVTLHGDTDRVMSIIGGPVEFGGRKQYLELLCEDFTTDGANG